MAYTIPLSLLFPSPCLVSLLSGDDFPLAMRDFAVLGSSVSTLSLTLRKSSGPSIRNSFLLYLGLFPWWPSLGLLSLFCPFPCFCGWSLWFLFCRCCVSGAVVASLADGFSIQRQMALARSFNKPERHLHFANSAN